VDPYWLAEPHPAVARGAPAGTPDVAVVGAGVTGCSAAYELARAGLRVRLYDARAVAGGASGRNGGFALRGLAAPYDAAVENVGPNAAAAIWRWTEEELARLAGLAGDAFRPTGSLRLANDEDEREELRREYDTLAAQRFAVEWLDDLPGPLAGRIAGAILHPGDGALQPARWVRRLAGLAAKLGVEIREHERVRSLEETGASTTIVCTDGYPSGLLGELEGLIVPTRGQMIATEPLAERWFLTPHYGRHGFDYWHQTPDGRILAGGFRDTSLDAEFTDIEETTPGIQTALEDHVARLAGRRLRVDYRWAGIFGLVLDFLPVVGRVPGLDGVWVAGGYSGHGNVLGFACGALVARTVLGRPDPLLELFDPARLLGPRS
jgi:glycine/D-amino acid oxidase-like deaminating enzyme